MRAVAGLLVAVGLVLSGWFIGHGFERGRSADRYVTVKGVSERDVKADLALWPLTVVVTDDDLARAQAKIDANTKKVIEFLSANGIPGGNVSFRSLRVTDVTANPYRPAGGATTNRFIVNQSLVVRSDQPDVVFAASQKVGDLVAAGVVLSSGSEYGPGGPTFIFTGLNSLKPEMIAEATARAREAAQQFATDSGSELGKIRRANQGVFVILPRDQAPGISEESQMDKTVRVVSTIDYSLKD